jgi:preprotein translocase subunit SecA
VERTLGVRVSAEAEASARRRLHAPAVRRGGTVGIRNRIGWQEWLGRLQGSPIDLNLLSYDSPLAEINQLEEGLTALSAEDLQHRARVLGRRARAGEPLDALRVTLFALAREAARRSVGLRPFDEQVVAGLALDRGRIVEMQTGEGKTLAAVMPAALNALTGDGVHVLTFNDYLARRDAHWMGPIYRLLGLSVSFVQQGMIADERRRAYASDITYVTAKEAGFDHLRDLVALDAADVVHRGFHFALVDEADSLLIDEARVPLVIAGHVGREMSAAPRLAAVVSSLSAGLHFDTDEYGRDVEFTDAGIEQLEQALACGSLHDERNIMLLTQLNCALHARVLLRRDVDYIVRDGRILIVDEFTGRVVTDRHWPDGLQAALEAKEGLEQRPDGRILGSMTLQRFLRGYSRLCGMTGTASDAAIELRTFYGVEVLVVPTHRPVIRIDRPDIVFTHREAKESALVAEIGHAHESGRPVLVGTLTVEESERLADRLRSSGIVCEVLNAKNDEQEARIVARAGTLGAVTISTNMAGRGTDIRLGGEDEGSRERVAALGGLYVIGTNRHESRRVDLQLRGRAGRQGDPGESRFFLSLEDDLLVRYGIQNLLHGRFVPGRLDQPIDDALVNEEIARAQRIIEGQNFEVRKTLSRYSSVVEDQHRVLMERRQALLYGNEVPDIWKNAAPERYETLVAACGEDEVERAERAVTLFHIDRAWREHLAHCADLREGIHLVSLGGMDPLSRFTSDVMAAFRAIDAIIDKAVLDTLPLVTVGDAGLDLGAAGAKGPSSTWTYLVNDDPFRNQVLLKLIGPGGTTIAIYASALLGPLFLLWGVVERFLRKRRPRV